MHIRSYDFDYSRRRLLENTLCGAGGAGVLAALWPVLASAGDVGKAYPEELNNIEAFTKGRIKIGDVIDRDNIDLVQDLVDPIVYQEVKQDGRKFFYPGHRNRAGDALPALLPRRHATQPGAGRVRCRRQRLCPRRPTLDRRFAVSGCAIGRRGHCESDLELGPA